MTGTTIEKRPGSLSVDVLRLMAWTDDPQFGVRDGAAVREAVAPTALRWATTARPKGIMKAHRLVTAAIGFAAFARRTLCAVDFDAALTPDLVRRHMVVAAAGPEVWRALCAMGRAVNPDVWPPEDDDSDEGDSPRGADDSDEGDSPRGADDSDEGDSPREADWGEGR